MGLMKKLVTEKELDNLKIDALDIEHEIWIKPRENDILLSRYALTLLKKIEE